MSDDDDDEDDDNHLGKIDKETLESVVGSADPVNRHFTRVKARKSEKTLQNRRVSFRQFLEFCQSRDLGISDISGEEINLWIDELLIDDYAPRSIRTKVYDVSALFQSLSRRGVVGSNPVEDVELKQYSATRIGEHTEVRYLEVEEYEALRDAASKLRNRLVIEILWETGVRAVEAVSIRLRDIDREERKIKIDSAKKGELSASQTRKVYYSRKLERTLTEWIDRGGRSRYLGAESGQGHLLITKEADRMARNRVGEIVTDLASEAGIQEVLYEDQSGTERRRVTPHALRHSFAVHRVKNGMPLVYLQDLLGHEDIEVTRKYLQFRDDDIAEAERKYRPA